MVRTNDFITVKHSVTSQSKRAINICYSCYPRRGTEAQGSDMADSERWFLDVTAGLTSCPTPSLPLAMCMLGSGLFPHLPLPSGPNRSGSDVRGIWVSSQAQSRCPASRFKARVERQAQHTRAPLTAHSRFTRCPRSSHGRTWSSEPTRPCPFLW